MVEAVNAMVVRQNDFKSFLENPRVRERLASIISKHMTPERVIKMALLAGSRNPKLYECTHESLLRSMMTASELGLEFGGSLGQGYPVPYWNSKINQYECQFIAGYRGLIALAHNSGDVATITARVVYANDKFAVHMGTHEDLQHTPDLENPGPPVFAYAVCTFKDGIQQWDVMSRHEIEAIKNRTKSRSKSGEISGPWMTDELEMWKKTVVRRLMKYLPLSVEARDAIEVEDEEFLRAEVRNITPTRSETMQALNAPSEDPVSIDLGGITEVEPEPVEAQASEPAPEVKQRQRRPPAPEPTPEPTPVLAVDIHPKLQEKIDAIGKFGISREFLENYYNMPAQEWRVGVVRAIDLATSKFSMGGSIEEIFPQVGGVN